MYVPVPAELDAQGIRIAIAVSRYHETITGPLREDAAACFLDAGGAEADLLVVEAPGAFELAVLCGHLARREDIDGVVALGCVITGETTHDQYINQAVSTTLAGLAVETGVPVAFGVLTCQDLDQARARAGGDKGNKGREAMAAVLQSIAAIRALAETEATSSS